METKQRKTKNKPNNVYNSSLAELPALKIKKSIVVSDFVVENITIEARGYTLNDCMIALTFLIEQSNKIKTKEAKQKKK